MNESNSGFEDGDGGIAGQLNDRALADGTAGAASKMTGQGRVPRPTLPRVRRADDPPALVLTDRDRALLEDVWKFGILTTTHLEMLRGHDPDPGLRFVSRLTLTRRLKLLFHHGYLRRIVRPLAAGSQEFLYILDHGGARELSLRHGEVRAKSPSRLPKAMALEHTIGIVDVRVSLTVDSLVSQSPETSLKVGEFTEHRELSEWFAGNSVKFTVYIDLHGERRHHVSIIPDAAYVVRYTGRRYYTFLEVDNGTESARILLGKVVAYLAYLQGGGFARDWNVPDNLGFQVRFVMPSAKRSQSIQDAVYSQLADRQAKLAQKMFQWVLSRTGQQ